MINNIIGNNTEGTLVAFSLLAAVVKSFWSCYCTAEDNGILVTACYRCSSFNSHCYWCSMILSDDSAGQSNHCCILSPLLFLLHCLAINSCSC